MSEVSIDNMKEASFGVNLLQCWPEIFNKWTTHFQDLAYFINRHIRKVIVLWFQIGVSRYLLTQVLIVLLVLLGYFLISIFHISHSFVQHFSNVIIQYLSLIKDLHLYLIRSYLLYILIHFYPMSLSIDLQFLVKLFLHSLADYK
jgi:hypothetical protein